MKLCLIVTFLPNQGRYKRHSLPLLLNKTKQKKRHLRRNLAKLYPCSVVARHAIWNAGQELAWGQPLINPSTLTLNPFFLKMSSFAVVVEDDEFYILVLRLFVLDSIKMLPKLWLWPVCSLFIVTLSFVVFNKGW